MAMTLTTARRGLLYIAAPLVLQAAFLAALVAMQRQQDGQRRQAMESAQIKYQVHAVHGLLMDVESGLRGYVLTGDRQFLQSYHRAMEEMAGEFFGLHELLRAETGSAAAAQGLAAAAQAVLAYQSQNLALMDHGRREEVVERVARRMGKLRMDAFREEMDAFLDGQEQLESQRLAAATASHRRLSVALFTGVLLNIAMGAFMIRLFCTGITRRLGVILDNALRLKRGEALLPRLAGADELALVDATFHEMAQALQGTLRRVSHAAMHDALTGLPNRALFQERLAHRVALAQRYEGRFSLLYLDLDGFKGVNDRLGHAAGDWLLSQVAHRLRGVLRDSDTVARLGGDEFTVLLPRTGGRENAEAIAAKIVRAISRPFEHEGERLAVSASVGAAIFPDHGATAEALVAAADEAMYDAKRGGKNAWAFARRTDGWRLHAAADAAASSMAG